MNTQRIEVERVTVVSADPFEQVIARLESRIGHPDMPEFMHDVAAAKTYPDVERIVHEATGSSELMEMARFDLGEVLRKETGRESPKVMRFVIGNPLVMKQMVVHVRDAASYAPVTVLVDERPDGVHLSYDTMASLLMPYGSPDALKVARDLDTKIEGLLTAAAG